MQQRPDPDDDARHDERYEIAPGVVAEPSGERVVVLHAGGSELSTLSPVGSVIWQFLPSTRAEILAELKDRYTGVDADMLTADFDSFVGDLMARGLVVSDNART